MMIRFPTSLEGWLPFVNAALYVLQIVITAVSFSTSDATRNVKTPIEPADFAFAIWNLIYALLLATVVVDAVFPAYSLFAKAEKPTVLRVCFSLSCVFNAGWVLLFNNGLPSVAGVDITLLWMTLLPIYLFANVEREARPFRWRQYLFSELGLRLYLSWITAAMVISWAIAAQRAFGDLTLGANLGLLGLVVVVALAGVAYGHDPVIGLVTVWALYGLAVKNTNELSGEELQLQVRIQSAAALAAGVVFAMTVLSMVEQRMSQRRHSRAWLAYVKLDNDDANARRGDYGSIR
ncbi:hypothetical protein PINS_up010104 [Pythium insidiosum]|nr:hypothetical protein PINS_up010104 [Pythium insidiosum]